MTNPAAMNEHEAAKYIGLSVAFLRNARTRGNLPGRTPGPPFLKLGNQPRSRVLYRVTDLDAWLEKHRVPQSQEKN